MTTPTTSRTTTSSINAAHRWVEPVIEAEVAYSTVTEGALLREAVFKGLREDREVLPARRS
jgi:ATP-dependent DNA ligase